MEHESDVYANYNWCSWYSHRRIIKGTRGLGNKRTCGDNPIYDPTEIGQNTEKCPGDLRRLAVNQTSVKDHQQRLTGKTLKEYKHFVVCLKYCANYYFFFFVLYYSRGLLQCKKTKQKTII